MHLLDLIYSAGNFYALTGKAHSTIKQRMTQGGAVKKLPVATPRLDHFHALMGPHGLWQHATGRVPNLAEGYCTDDNARAVQVLLHLKSRAEGHEIDEIDALLGPCWRFLREAQETPGDYWNFRDASGAWLPQGRSGDMYARIFRALVTVLILDSDESRQREAQRSLLALEPHLRRLTAPRAWAEIALAAASLLVETRQKDGGESLERAGVECLKSLWRAEASPAWPWFEAKMTYANALFPHALLSVRKLLSAEEESLLHDSAQFLIRTTVRDGVFIPIGSNGWYPRDGVPSADNQQPIEAGTMFDFLMDYYAHFPEQLSIETVAAPYVWFFGKNSHRQVMADAATGACFDGILIDRINTNCGAESMLAYLWAEVRYRHSPPDLQAYIQKERERLQLDAV